MKVGVLCLQGAFIEHIKVLEKIGIDCIELRKKSDIIENNLDGIVLPGGESTVQGKLLRDNDMYAPLKKLIDDGTPVLATCAGLILLALHINDDDTVHFGTLPVTVKRNAYGRQLGSFITRGEVGNIPDCEMIFIRAPYISEICDDSVKVLSKVEGKIVCVRYKNQLAMAFHPELAEDLKIHFMFRDMIERFKKSKNKI